MIQAWDFAPGRNFVAEMQRASEQSRAVIAVFSERYRSSPYTEDEWTAALKDRKLLLARVSGDWPEGILGAQIAVDLVDADEEEAKSRLLDAAGRVLQRVAGGADRAKPSRAPTFPPQPRGERPVVAPAAFPGGDVRHVPRAPNPNFTGRAGELEAVRDILGRGRRVALTGLGGLGKSQLAVEYIHAHASEYAVVWWIRAEDDTTIVEDLARLATALGIAPADADLGEAAEAVRSELERRDDWLLVFDNANSPSGIRPYLPNRDGRVIITSRPRAWREVAIPLDLPALSPEAAERFLRARSGDDDAQGAAAAVAEELGYLPLALEQAAAYVEETESTLSAYLTAFRERQAELLREGIPSDYPASVASTWELSFQALERDAPAAAQLLELAAFLAPDEISLRLLSDRTQMLPSPLREAALDPFRLNAEVVRPLLRFGLVDRAGDDLVVHRLVQAVTRARIPARRASERALQAATAVLESFDFERYSNATWPWAGRLVPHALAAARHAVDRAGAVETGALLTAARTGAVLLAAAGQYLRTRGQYADARGSLEEALSLCDEHPRLGDELVSSVLTSLGRILWDLDDFSGARRAAERALEIDERLHGADDPIVATDLNHLGAALAGLGDFAGARAAHERALAISENAREPDESQIAACLSNLGRVRMTLGELDAAREACERALAILEHLYGPDHPEVAVVLTNVGEVQRRLGDPAAACEAHRRAVAIDEKIYGREHPEVATDLENLAMALLGLREFDEARASQTRALQILEPILGADHPRVAYLRATLEILRRPSPD